MPVRTKEVILNNKYYIRRNPIERKLCQRAVDFRWSSASYYLAEPAEQQFEELPRVHGLRAEAFDPSASR